MSEQARSNPPSEQTETPPPTLGRAFTLALLPAQSALAYGPAWSTLCGAWAAHSEGWTVDRLLGLAVTLIITELLWSSWRAQLIDADWPAYLVDHPLPAFGGRLLAFPYVLPTSPLGRALGFWGRVRRWARETLSLQRRGALVALPVLPVLILVFSALLGRPAVVLSAAALALILLEWQTSRRGQRHEALRAGLEIGLSWLAGHLVLGTLTVPSLALACCYAIAYQGILRQGLSPLTRPTFSLALLLGGQAAALGVVLWAVRPQVPLTVLGMGWLLAPQVLLLAAPQESRPAGAYWNRIVPFIMLAMLLAAWTI